MSTELQIGRPVPDFTLPASNGRDMSLSNFRGRKLVIYFYPHDMTPTCTEESCSFRDHMPEFRDIGAEIVGISTDDAAKHKRFIEKYELPFVLLADEEHRVSELFGVWQPKKLYGREYMGIVRSTFLLDEQGVLLKEWRNVKVKGHVQAVADTIAALNG